MLVGHVPVAAQTGADGLSYEKPLQRAVTGETSSFVVEFDARADLSDAYAVADHAARGQLVMERLEATAAASQAAVLRLIKATRGASGEGFWMRNVVVFEGDQALADEIAAMPGVRQVRKEQTYQIARPVEVHQAEPADGAEWGVERIGAPAAWDQGIFGSGIVVASLDSGVDYLHPALVDKYRGNNQDGTFTHDYNWFDASADCPADEPCDLLGHGTHTMGTMVGGDGPGPFTPDIGVAPGAQWMTVSCGPGFCSESQLMAAGEFFIAPTDLNGENPDPGMRPDIVNNSWGGPPGDPFFLDMVDAWRAAGIVPVFASGNPGPFCGEGGSPGDYLSAFSVGATDIEDVIAEFSGRGPSVFGKINPDVAAPGVNVVSSVPGGGYEAFDGTSMATPHVVGALALLMSAAPDLIGDVDSATNIVRATAMDIIDESCGGAEGGDPNNVYGDGRIDAAAAVALAATGGVLTGTVRDAENGRPIAGARVVASGAERDFGAFTKADGTYKLFLQEGTYTVTASVFAYETATVPGVEVIQDTTTIQDIDLTKLPTGIVTGRIFEFGDGRRVPGATVEVLGTPIPRQTVGHNARYSFVLPVGTYTLAARQGGCTETELAEVEITEEARIVRDFELVRKIDDFGYGCETFRSTWRDVTLPDSLYFDDTVGKLPLPFDFPFYGESHSQVFITANGYVTFEPEPFAEFFNSAIPSSSFPNNAIYGLWQDLWIFETGQAYTGTSYGRSWTLQYDNLAPLGSEDGFDMQIKLYKSGTIELIYGNGLSNVGFGSSGTVGIEGPLGENGVQYSFREDSLQRGQGIRFEVLPTGFVGGTVTNANDGLGAPGVRITAVPSGRSTTTGPDGEYLLRLLPGDYMITAEGFGYETETKPATIRVDQTTTVDFALRAPVLAVSPEALEATVDLGDAADFELEVRNDGSSELTWSALGIETEAIPPELPPVMTANGTPYVRTPGWFRPDLPPELLTADVRVAAPTFEGPLDVIIEDPPDDSIGDNELIRVLGGADDVEASLELVFEPDTALSSAVGFVFLDTDQDSSTGLPAEELNGLPTQDVGMEYFVDLFLVPEGFVLIVDAELFEIVAEVPVEFFEDSYRFDIPLEAIGGDDGAMNVALVIGDFDQPTDWAPDEGFGELGPGRPAEWIALSQTEGVLEPGAAATVTATLGGPGIDPGTYEGEIRFESNDPRNPRLAVPAALEVLLPENFGSIQGTVADAFFEFPVIGAEVTLSAEDGGAPYVVSDFTGAEGFYQLFAPEGEWPMTVAAEGYLLEERTVTISAGESVTEDVGLTPLGGIAGIEFGDMAFTLGPDETETRTITLTNEGTEEYEFEILEFEVPAFERAPTATYPDGVTSRTPLEGIAAPWTVSRPSDYVYDVFRGVYLPDFEPTNGALWLVLMDELPWLSEAWFVELEANGVVYDVAPSEAMGEIPLEQYSVVLIPNDQPQQFYDRYNENLGWFEDYLFSGGVLFVGAASEGFNGGQFGEGVLPGGPPIVEEAFEELNIVIAPDHPLVSGVPEEIFGDFASHSGFNGIDGLPGPAQVIAVGDFEGWPTLVEYELGAGTVVATGQTLEFGYEEGQDAGQILVNAVPYLGSLVGPPPDIPWLTVEPAAGVVPPGEAQPIDVTVNTAELEPGLYGGDLVVLTTDLFGSVFFVPVTLEVTPML
jgi:subtilisin family serine protease